MSSPPPRPAGLGLKWVVGIAAAAVLALILTIVFAVVFVSGRIGGLLDGGDAGSPSPSEEVPADFDGSLCRDIDVSRFEELTGSVVDLTSPGEGSDDVDTLSCTYENQDGQSLYLSVNAGDVADYAETTIADRRASFEHSGYEVADATVDDAAGFSWRLVMEGAEEYGVTVGLERLVVSVGLTGVDPGTSPTLSEEFATLLLDHYAAYL